MHYRIAEEKEEAREEIQKSFRPEYLRIIYFMFNIYYIKVFLCS